jgi:pimeloyl-ACP methyl ester carboxylesterase
MSAGHERIDYDEFGLFHENAEEFGLPFAGPPVVRRTSVEVGPGRRLSVLVWGDTEPQLVFLHGGAQNAHTWDTVALALGVPLIAIDLPGHGHSDGPDPAVGSLSPQGNAADVAKVIEALAPHAEAVVGMSLGGLTTIALAGARPDLVKRMVVVDVTPGVNAEKSRFITNFVNGPEAFPDFGELLARTIEHNPTRTVSSLRRGILHNAVQLDDGSWRWRYRRHGGQGLETSKGGAIDFSTLWPVLATTTMPVLLTRGLREQSVIVDADVAEFVRLRPDAEVVDFPEAGHSLQGDTPLELADAIRRFALGG